ncbi:MAG: 4-alpha-glucanotransferase [Puniceicoccales bacterium]|jgi:4-alpha-glucanotransferase|nr:4-alpha-glucanotransferase [Puniceicoccales bacterium]
MSTRNQAIPRGTSAGPDAPSGRPAKNGDTGGPPAPPAHSPGPEGPLFSGFRKRSAGVWLHPTCLPSRQGVGTLASARGFLEFIAECGLEWWQICPCGPTGHGDSPYQCFSSFAGNPYLLDLDTLAGHGLAGERELAPLRGLAAAHVEYGFLWEHFHPAMAAIWRNVKARPAVMDELGDLAAFRRENAFWLEDYALFTALKKHFGGRPWHSWPEEARIHARATAGDWPDSVRDDAECAVFQQFLFDTQWARLRREAAALGVRILGDIPIFAAPDSADAWASPELFQFTQEGLPKCVAGVPPDYFSPRGQLWGNPLYDWDAMRRTGYHWWMRRLASALGRADAMRIDHFRGFHDYWSIPAGAVDAREGGWRPGPGMDFFRAMRSGLGDAPLIAEDLGELSDGVLELRKATGLPGMAVLQFAFGGDAANTHLPHNQRPDCAVYTGTHDNDTTAGWYAATTESQRDFFRRYLGCDGSAPHWDAIRAAFTSPASLAVVPMQDILGKDSQARFNTPGTASGNWRWRLREGELEHARTFLAPTLRKLAAVSGR